MPIHDPAIFPASIRHADLQPEDLHCDERRFKNYPGVEEQDVTDTELSSHLQQGHLAAFDSYAELAAYVGSSPILNKLGLIVKTRNGITKSRMILDTKESGVKTITSQAQRLTLPSPFDAILQILFLLACVASGVSGAWEMVETFVLDFSDAYWQIPIHKAEQQFFCATSLIGGKRKWFVFLRAAQGSSAGGTLWNRLSALLMRLTQSLYDPS